MPHVHVCRYRDPYEWNCLTIAAIYIVYCGVQNNQLSLQRSRGKPVPAIRVKIIAVVDSEVNSVRTIRHTYPLVPVLLMISLLIATPGWGDTTTSSTRAQPKRWFSFTPRPLPECRHFLITEFGVVYRCDNPPKAEADVWTTFLAEAGFMSNVTFRSAIGCTLFGESGGDGSRVGIRGRYRLWLKPRGKGPQRSSLDITPGVILWGTRKYACPPLSGSDDPDLPNTRILYARYPGLATSVALNWREWLGIMFHVEHIPLDQVSPPPLSETAPRRTHDTA